VLLFFFFEMRSWFMPRLAWTMLFLFVLPYIGGMTNGVTMPRHRLIWGSLKLFTQGCPWTMILQYPPLK
jgi:hypothetical protein